MIQNIAVKPTFKKMVKRGTSFVLATILVTSSNVLDVEAVNKQNINQLEMVDMTVYRGVNIYIDDKVYIPKNGYAAYIDPFIYNGTTYLPLVSISEIFGADVTWDGKNNAVLISKGQKGRDFITYDRSDNYLEKMDITAYKGVKIYVDGIELKDTDGKDIISYVWGGVTYVPARAISKVFETPIYWESPTNSVYIGNHVIKKRVESFPNDPKLQRAIDLIEKYTPLYEPYPEKILELFSKMITVEIDISNAIKEVKEQFILTPEAEEYVNKAYEIVVHLSTTAKALGNCDSYKNCLSRLSAIERIKQNGGECDPVDRSIIISSANVYVLCYDELLGYFATYTDEYLKEIYDEAIGYLEQAKQLSSKVKVKSLN